MLFITYLHVNRNLRVYDNKMAPPPKSKIHNFKYQKTQDFKTSQIHGVYGGINMRGQLNMNFYVEAADLQKTSFAPIVDNKLAPEEFPVMTERHSVRELQFGINVDLDIAKATALWMLKHIEEYEIRLKEINDTTQSQKNKD